MFKKDSQPSQNKANGPLIFEESKWNNIPECIISFFTILNSKILEIEANHSTFKSKSEQSFTKQNQVINECKTQSEETEMKFNLSSQTLTASIKDIKNKCENANSIMKIKMEEEIEKINKRLDDITRGVNLKIDDNVSLLHLIKKEADLTKEMFQQAMNTQKDEERIINIVKASPSIVEFIKSKIGLEEQLNEIQKQVKIQASSTLISLLDSNDEESSNESSQNQESDNNNNKGILLKKIDKRIQDKVKVFLNTFQEEIENNQVKSNDIIIYLDKETKLLKDKFNLIENTVTKCEKERKQNNVSKIESKYNKIESQISIFNDNFEKIQSNINLLSQRLSHKLYDQVKIRSCTPTQFETNNNKLSDQADEQPPTFTQTISELVVQNKDKSNKDKYKEIDLNLPTMQSESKEDVGDLDTIQTVEERMGLLQQKINMLEIQFNALKNSLQKEPNSDTEDNTKQTNPPAASKTNLIDKPWLSGQEVILKEGDNLAIKVFQKSQSINKKSSKYSQMYTNPQVMAKKYRNSILGTDTEIVKQQNGMDPIRQNSHSRIQDNLAIPSNMTNYYKQNYINSDSSPEKSKKNSVHGMNSSNDLQFTNDLIKSQLDNYTNKAKAQLEQIKTDMNWMEGINQNQNGQSNNNINHPSNGDLRQIATNSRARHRTFHSSAANNSLPNNNVQQINSSQDQISHSFIQSNQSSMPQTGTNLLISQNTHNFQPPPKSFNQQESPINTYKIAKNVMKNTKLKSFRISQGVSFDAINLSKY